MPKQFDRIPKALLERQSVEALEQMLVQEFDSPEQDTQYINEIMEVIESKQSEQFASPAETESAWAEFNTDYLPHAEEAETKGGKIAAQKPDHRKSSPNPLRKVISVAAVIAATLACLMVVQASGINILGAMGTWSQELFHFHPSASVKEGNATSPMEYEATIPEIEKALTENGISTTLAPKSVPAGMALKKIRVSNSEYITKIDIEFSSSSDETIYYSILQHSSADSYTGLQFEKLDASVSEYVHNNMRFYIFDNVNGVRAIWSDGLNTICISGSYDCDTIYRMIDSI